jgi:hypothetical protein
MDFDRYCGMASAVGILLILTMVIWLDLSGPISVEGIKGWQTLIGFGGTLIVGMIAWVNVSRQLAQQRVGTRLALLSREEDRIESEVPGLKDAQMTARHLYVVTKSQIEKEDFFTEIAKRIVKAGFTDIRSSIDIAAVLPVTDLRTRDLLLSRIQVMQARCELGKRGNLEERAEQRELLRENIEGLNDFADWMAVRREELLSRLPAIRAEIERNIIAE